LQNSGRFIFSRVFIFLNQSAKALELIEDHQVRIQLTKIRGRQGASQASDKVGRIGSEWLERTQEPLTIA
jgi:hypothetical protein